MRDVAIEIIEFAKPFIDAAYLQCSSESERFFGRIVEYDFIRIGRRDADDKNVIRISVYDEGLIVGYLGDHIHFDDIATEPVGGESNYLSDCKEFLHSLLTLNVEHEKVIDGRGKLHSEKYSFISPDGSNTEIDVVNHGLFRRKRSHWTERYQFDCDAGVFVRGSLPSGSCSLGEELVKVNDVCHIVLKSNRGGFSFELLLLSRSEYDDTYYYAPLTPPGISIFDTKEKALAAAHDFVRTSKYRIDNWNEL